MTEYNLYDFPTHLQPFAYFETSAVRKILTHGKTLEFAHLDIPEFKRGEGKLILQMIEAKESGKLKIETGEILDPQKNKEEWERKNATRAQNAKKRRRRPSSSPEWAHLSCSHFPFLPNEVFESNIRRVIEPTRLEDVMVEGGPIDTWLPNGQVVIYVCKDCEKHWEECQCP